MFCISVNDHRGITLQSLAALLLPSLLLLLGFHWTHAQKDMDLVGLGASLPVEVYEAWAPAFENYRSQFVSLDNEYYARGNNGLLASNLHVS